MRADTLGGIIRVSAFVSTPRLVFLRGDPLRSAGQDFPCQPFPSPASFSSDLCALRIRHPGIIHRQQVPQRPFRDARLLMRLFPAVSVSGRKQVAPDALDASGRDTELGLCLNPRPFPIEFRPDEQGRCRARRLRS